MDIGKYRTIIHYPVELRLRWPSSLANEWAAGYPLVFKDEDLERALLVPSNVFCEWFAALHLFHSHGVLSLVQPYFRIPSKALALRRALGYERMDKFARIILESNLIPPHLLCYDKSRIWFALVKGPGTPVIPQHLEAANLIKQVLEIPVSFIEVRQWGAGTA